MILLLLWGALALAAPRLLSAGEVDAADAQRLFSGRRLALLVGPSAWQDPGFAPLRFTDEDALALAEVLADPARGHFDQVVALTRPEETTAAAVRAAMRALAEEVRSPDDTVFVYFSTHGTLAGGPHGDLRQFLVLSDTRLAQVSSTGLSHEELLAWMEGLPSRRKVLMLATCHSGSGKSALPSEVAAQLASIKGAAFLTPLREVSEAVVLIGVCAWSETARESAELGHDIYTWFFLKALEEADADGDGAVTITEAHDAARQATYAHTQGQQRPYALVEILGADPIVMSGERHRGGGATLGSYRARLDGYRLQIDGQAKGALPGTVAVAPGRHRVELLGPEGDHVLARQRLELDADSRLDVDRLLRRDLVRVAVGGGYLATSAVGAGGPAAFGELHLPRLFGAWELIAHGTFVARWPSPTLEGALLLERPLTPGALQVRLGGGLEGFLLGAPGDPALLAPSLVPVPVLALAWLPQGNAFLRLSGVGGYLWYTDRGAWTSGWTGRVALAGGLRL